MGLKREIKEELEEEAFRESQRKIVDKYYTDPDEEMRGFGSSALHRSIFGEYEPTPEQRRMMELELEINRLKYGRGGD